MHAIGLIPLAFLASLTAAKKCTNTTVPVTISARQGIFNLAVPETSLDATTLIQNITQQGRNFSDVVLTGYQTVSGTYNISAQVCLPDNGHSQNPVAQLLTHGIGFDKTYWDLAYAGFSYSYVDVAVDNYQYTTIAIDRLGIGLSSHGTDVLNEIQAPLEVAALAEVTRKLRAGTFPGAPSGGFKKVVHVGHSFGSAQSYALAAAYPDLSDGLILTGFSMNGTFVPYFAAGANLVQAYENQPFRLGNQPAGAQGVPNAYGQLDYAAPPVPPGSAPLNYPCGYLTNANVNANQYLFFLPGYFDQQLLMVGEMSKQPVTPGELLTLPSLPMINDFKGPVLVFTGSNDLPYCGGDCLATGNPAIPSIPSTVSKNFPAAGANYETYIQPTTGHGLNFHYNATAGYKVIQEFLAKKGLKA